MRTVVRSRGKNSLPFLFPFPCYYLTDTIMIAPHSNSYLSSTLFGNIFISYESESQGWKLLNESVEADPGSNALIIVGYFGVIGTVAW